MGLASADALIVFNAIAEPALAQLAHSKLENKEDASMELEDVFSFSFFDVLTLDF